MNRIRLQFSVAAAAAILAFVGGVARAQLPPPPPPPPHYPDSLVVFGTGNVVNWTTELTLSNPRETPMSVDVTTSPVPIVCILPCDFTHEIPSRGTVVLGAPPPDAVGVTYVGGLDVPRVHARVLDTRGRSVDLPVFRLSTLLALDASELVFPGALRSAQGTVNLLLANIWDDVHFTGAPVTLRLEAFDADGASLGSRDLALAKGQTLFATDALGSLGVGVAEVGQLSVRRVAGSGRFWGILSIVRADGSLSVSVGATP